MAFFLIIPAGVKEWWLLRSVTFLQGGILGVSNGTDATSHGIQRVAHANTKLLMTKGPGQINPCVQKVTELHNQIKSKLIHSLIT